MGISLKPWQPSLPWVPPALGLSKAQQRCQPSQAGAHTGTSPPKGTTSPVPQGYCRGTRRDSGDTDSTHTCPNQGSP